MTTKLCELPEEKRGPAIVRHGDGTPVPAEKPTRAECLEKRREAAKKIAEIREQHEPLVQQAAARLADASRRLTAAKSVLAESEQAARDACRLHESAVRQRDTLVGEQERIIGENPDVELKRTINELEGELHDVMQNATGKPATAKRIEKLRAAIAKARELHADPGILNTVKLDAALVALALTRNG